MPEFEQILTMFLIFALMGICPEENTELHVDAEGHFSIHRGSGGDGGPSRPVSSIPGIKDFATALYEFLDKDCLIPDLLAQVAACAAKIRLAGGLASQLSGFKAALDRKKSNNKGAVEFLNGAYKRCKEDLEDLVRGLDEAVGKILDEGDLGNKPALFAAHVASLLQGHVQEELRPNLVLARVLIEGEWKPVFLRRFVAGTSVKNEKKRRQDEDGGGGDGEAEDGGDGVAGDDYAGRWDDDDMLPDAPHDVRSEMKRVERQFLSIPARLGRQIVRARDAGATIPDVILKRVKEPGGNWKQGAELTEALAGLSAAVAHKYLCTESMIALKPLVPGVGDPLKPSDLKRPRDDSLHHDAVKELGAKEARELWERTLEGHSVILNTDPEIEGTLPGVPFAVLLDRNNFGPLVRGELTKTNLRMLIVLQSKGVGRPSPGFCRLLRRRSDFRSPILAQGPSAIARGLASLGQRQDPCHSNGQGNPGRVHV
ncbi:hypothetical protein DFJ74DRAFT_677079 [Hyaloraphidium curvatum]|nr:hypothetical protein DFJ74DRAFT_677079 [Hyaloraphidium curvatum]